MADCFIVKRNPIANKKISFDKWEHTSGASGYSIDGDGWVSGFSSKTYIGIKKPFTYTQSFEIMINFILTSTPTGNTVIGSSVNSSSGYFKAPSFSLNPNSMWAVLSYNGTQWDKNINVSNLNFELNKEYYLKYSHDVTTKILKLEISYDGETWETLSELNEVSIGYQSASTEYLEIGGVAQSSVYFACGKINIFKSYILTDEELFWGIKYE